MRFIRYIFSFFQKNKKPKYNYFSGYTLSIDANILRALVNDIQAHLEYLKTSKSVFNKLYILFMRFFSIKTPEDIVYEKFYLLLSKKITITHSNTENDTFNEKKIRKKIYENSLKVYYDMKNKNKSHYLEIYTSKNHNDVKKFFSLFKNIEAIMSEEINCKSPLHEQYKQLFIQVKNNDNNSENCDNFNFIKNKILCINNIINQFNNLMHIKKILLSKGKKIKYIKQFIGVIDKFNQSIAERCQDQKNTTLDEIMEESITKNLAEMHQNQIQSSLSDFIKNNPEILPINEQDKPTMDYWFNEVCKKIDSLYSVVNNIILVVIQTYEDIFPRSRTNDFFIATIVIKLLQNNGYDIKYPASEVKYLIKSIIDPFETLQRDFENLTCIYKNDNLHSNKTTSLIKVDQNMKIESIKIDETEQINMQC